MIRPLFNYWPGVVIWRWMIVSHNPVECLRGRVVTVECFHFDAISSWIWIAHWCWNCDLGSPIPIEESRKRSRSIIMNCVSQRIIFVIRNSVYCERTLICVSRSRYLRVRVIKIWNLVFLDYPIEGMWIRIVTITSCHYKFISLCISIAWVSSCIDKFFSTSIKLDPGKSPETLSVVSLNWKCDWLAFIIGPSSVNCKRQGGLISKCRLLCVRTCPTRWIVRFNNPTKVLLNSPDSIIDLHSYIKSRNIWIACSWLQS